jgi:hypothetical protein
MMRLRVPTMVFEPPGASFATRPRSLDGLRIGFLDGWGDRKDNGVAMYPTMVEIERVLTERYSVAETVWQMKPSITEQVPLNELREFLNRVDVVVNGEGL